jgi:hypothetical protein
MGVNLCRRYPLSRSRSGSASWAERRTLTLVELPEHARVIADAAAQQEQASPSSQPTTGPAFAKKRRGMSVTNHPSRAAAALWRPADASMRLVRRQYSGLGAYDLCGSVRLGAHSAWAKTTAPTPTSSEQRN